MYLLYCPEGFTNRLAKTGQMIIEFFLECKNLQWYSLMVRTGKILNQDAHIRIFRRAVTLFQFLV